VGGRPAVAAPAPNRPAITAALEKRELRITNPARISSNLKQEARCRKDCAPNPSTGLSVTATRSDATE
jgi:hypothetical protein